MASCMLGDPRAERKEVMEIKTSRPMVFIFVKKPSAEFAAIKQHIEILLNSFAFIPVFWWLSKIENLNLK